ncbi:hypothetical protein LOZ12_004098 [Ophidiomyces ophidiicola]|uniref:Uncharacterized protein n=1 Tax=Ophidiomyces ophidiicola TaxID=1387563 RepID=A0ACB8V1E6_9EURO|nr:hypothetical protein LOZ56_003606 [Ophidiomyces ophidiicola]KAI2009762.1 hypothetical protein LOZ50_001496 [Ophidiomyces ophidiicola]KAI2028856.1 hypothetical protein LOZ48_003993 [Ophidiomyces ophidiicola]KAI2037984.1 hypothetical protein LOZ47_003457 [Ophidiomyces ophidiicola]KAI2043435.1 hypothetical protein LOZ44_005450 [Ophidiomyces ophidiicola]
MKTTIPSDVWESKKDEITNWYKVEEWPLKQVIKKVRCDSFDPTETQLRSRLKKWGVTKPNRQRRQKPESPTNDSKATKTAMPQKRAIDPLVPSFHRPVASHTVTENSDRWAFQSTNQEYLLENPVFLQSEQTHVAFAMRPAHIAVSGANTSLHQLQQPAYAYSTPSNSFGQPYQLPNPISDTNTTAGIAAQVLPTPSFSNTSSQYSAGLPSHAQSRDHIHHEGPSVLPPEHWVYTSTEQRFPSDAYHHVTHPPFVSSASGPPLIRDESPAVHSYDEKISPCSQDDFESIPDLRNWKRASKIADLQGNIVTRVANRPPRVRKPKVDREKSDTPKEIRRVYAEAQRSNDMEISPLIPSSLTEQTVHVGIPFSGTTGEYILSTSTGLDAKPAR